LNLHPKAEQPWNYHALIGSGELSLIGFARVAALKGQRKSLVVSKELRQRDLPVHAAPRFIWTSAHAKVASLSSQNHDLALPERSQKIGQSSGLLVAQFNGDRCWFIFNSDLKEHLNMTPSIPCVEMLYSGKNVWLNAIDLHCHSGPSATE
jgi:hypothetical protein